MLSHQVAVMMRLPLSLSALLLALTAQLAWGMEKIVDWSSASVLPSPQKWYDTDGTEASLERILGDNGFTLARQRLFTGPGEYDIRSNVQLAKRAMAVGMDIYINVHFRNGYNDPNMIQCDPRWGDTVETIAESIYQYCYSVGNQLAEQGVVPKYVSMGNEVAEGVCGGLGNITASPNGIKNTATFLHRASQGFRDSLLGSHTKLMIHLENAWNVSQSETWFGAIEQAGLPSTAWDVAGMTAYPFYHAKNATQENFYQSIKAVQDKYRKQVFIVETAWPRLTPEIMKAHALPPDVNFTVSVKGQSEWIHLFASTIARAGGSGIGYFEPAWLDNPATGSNFPNVLLFDDSGRALPSLAAFKSI